MIRREPRPLEVFRHPVATAVSLPPGTAATPVPITGEAQAQAQASQGAVACPRAIGLQAPGLYKSATEALFRAIRPTECRGPTLRRACLYAPADAAAPISTPRGRRDVPRRVLLMRGWQHTTEAAVPLKALVQLHVTESVVLISTRAHTEGAWQHLSGVVPEWQRRSKAERWERTSALALKDADSMNARARAAAILGDVEVVILDDMHKTQEVMAKTVSLFVEAGYEIFAVRLPNLRHNGEAHMWRHAAEFEHADSEAFVLDGLRTPEGAPVQVRQLLLSDMEAHLQADDWQFPLPVVVDKFGTATARLGLEALPAPVQRQVQQTVDWARRRGDIAHLRLNVGISEDLGLFFTQDPVDKTLGFVHKLMAGAPFPGPATFSQSASVILHRERDGQMEVFLVKERGGRVCFPAGSCETGETGVAGGTRELREETGLPVVSEGARVVGVTQSRKGPLGDSGNTLLTIAMKLDWDGKNEPLVQLQASEVAAGWWCTIEAAHQQITVDSAKEVLQAFAAGKGLDITLKKYGLVAR
jgi:8-oxo-dGTP pyrophosphatase MutT (NUDIX family)